MASAETWKWVITLQLGTAIPAVSFSVNATQYVIPHALQFLDTLVEVSWVSRGLWFGAFIGSYTLGRTVGTPVWLCLSSLCGRRPVLQVCLLVQFFLTLCFGLSSNAGLALGFRCGVGFFASGYALAGPILAEILAKDRDRVPAAAVTAVCFHSVMHAGGLVLGSVVVKNEEMPYLEASLINVILLLLAFVVISTDFPDTDSHQPAKKPKPVKKESPKKPRQKAENNGKFEEFNGEEVQHSVDQRDKEEEEVPSYLEQFASPAFPSLSVLKGVFTPEQEASTILEGDMTIDSGAREPDGHPTPDGAIKRTHISFVDEDLKDTAAKPEPADDRFYNDGRAPSLCSAAYLECLSLFLYLEFASAATEFMLLYYLLGPGASLAPKTTGTILAAAASISPVLQVLTGTWAAARFPLNRVGAAALVLAAMSAALLPFITNRDSEWPLYCALAVVLIIRDCALRHAHMVTVLRISACVTTDIRQSALSMADFAGALARSAGIILGPAAAALATHSLRNALAGSSAAIFVTAAVTMLATSGHYQLLQKAPYKI